MVEKKTLKKRKPGDIVDSLRVANRRKAVADLRARGMTADEIVSVLPSMGVVNEERGGSPYKRMTIYRDFEAIQVQWMKEASDTVDRHKARILAELQAVKTAAWSDSQLPVVLKALSQEAKILGLNSPELIALASGAPRDLTPDQARATLAAMASRLLESSRDDDEDASELRQMMLEEPPRVVEGKVSAST